MDAEVNDVHKTPPGYGGVPKRNSMGSQGSSPSGSPSHTPKTSTPFKTDEKALSGRDVATPPKEESPAGNRSGKKPSVRIKKQYSKIYRIKTKILQNLGKADKTTDEVFDEYESNFNKQQLHANRLHKEISNYLRCARALHGASKALYECLSEVYEPEWVGHDLLYVQAQNSDMLWSDFCHKLQDQTLAPLTAYAQDFPDIRKKIDKRGRKLVDYDSQRHQLENLQRSNRRDEYKIARGRDTLETARSTYQALNKELYDALPTIYDQRIPQTSSCLQTLYAAEATFMQESSKIAQELEAISEKLNKECTRGIYNAKRGVPPKEPKALAPPSTNSPSKACDDVTGGETQPKEAPQKTQDNRPAEVIPVGGDSPKGEEDTTKYSFYPQLHSKVRYNVAKVEQDLESVDLHAVEQDEIKERKLNEAPVQSKEPIHETIDHELVNNVSNQIKEDSKNVYDTSTDISTTNPFLVPDEIESPPNTLQTPPNLPDLPPPYSADPPSPSSQNPNNTEPRASEDTTSNRPTISSPVTPGKEEGVRPYEEIDFEEKVNGTRNVANTNGDIGQQIPIGATTDGLPPGVLYRVKASYKYQREDVDEISFDIGELIQVVEYEDPEEQEEGWLCGIKESTNEKGLFPANFTRPI